MASGPTATATATACVLCMLISSSTVCNYCYRLLCIATCTASGTAHHVSQDSNDHVSSAAKTIHIHIHECLQLCAFLDSSCTCTLH